MGRLAFKRSLTEPRDASSYALDEPQPALAMRVHTNQLRKDVMKAAVLSKLGSTPEFGEFAEPEPAAHQVVIEVLAAGVHHVDVLKGSGALSPGRAVPYVVGSDGVGLTPDGRRVFFDAPVAPFGSWSQRTVVAEDALLDIADELDDLTAAALGNTGLAAWLALSWRARLQAGESVLVLGASGALGAIAVQAAKAQGAAHVIAADRNAERLRRASARGADATVVIDDGDLTDRLREASGRSGIDVIIDPLWGPPALAAMTAASAGARLVQLGDSAARTVDLPGSVIRSSQLQVMGFRYFDAPLSERRVAYRMLTERAAKGDITVDVIPVSLEDADCAWLEQQRGARAKLIIVP
jgi:NADPH:quinone reductase-like Zn-dependent oxidoreductase